MQIGRLVLGLAFTVSFFCSPSSGEAVFGAKIASAAIPTNGLVAHYTFTGNANDVSGNGNHGVALNGATLTTDRFGNPNGAFAFDGIDDHIVVNDSVSFDFNQAVTFSVRLFTENPSHGGYVINKGVFLTVGQFAIVIPTSGSSVAIVRLEGRYGLMRWRM